ncbi:MAG: endonuclease I [Xanthomonadales bacterium]|nr:endonuclease [Gammaproteobacteria bacterium]MBT8054829.1 endonuclease [Gammaproteobacteria bacterium]NND58510.1 endonuclease I [Xanthomonadales bacterium]NNK51094.1 endonuclease I [Xanthomonadales bacterium]
MRMLALGAVLAFPPLLLMAETENYYEGVDDSSSTLLRQSLHELIDDHQRFPYTSSLTDTWDVLEMADQNPDDEGQVITLYRNAGFSKRGGGNDFYNREHTWPKSYGFPDNDSTINYPYTDMHALFLSDTDYNFARSNHPFDYCNENCEEYPTSDNGGRGGTGGGYPGDSNWQIGEFTYGSWEVWSGRRGDVARALMYMDVRYEGGSHTGSGASEPDLILTDDRQLIENSRTGFNEDTGYMGMLSVLLEWHLQDPVDLVEIQHHETVASFQGNRNPFIDHPEWVSCVFEDQCSSFVINSGLNDAWYDPETNGQGFFIIVWEDIQYMFIAWFTYDTERPPEDVKSLLGDPGHRWLTAQGPYAGNSVSFDINVTSGGIFDSALPAAGPAEVKGTMQVSFSDCNAGIIHYRIPSVNLEGEVSIQRVALDNVALCER